MDTQTEPTLGFWPVAASCCSYDSRAEKSVRKLSSLPALSVPTALISSASCSLRLRCCHAHRSRCSTSSCAARHVLS